MFGIDMKNLAHGVREGNSCREKKKKRGPGRVALKQLINSF